MCRIGRRVLFWLTLIDSVVCHRGHRHGGYLNPFLTKEASSTFLETVRGKRSVDCTGLIGSNIDCSVELSCECNQQFCTQESDREKYCGQFNTICSPGLVCYLSTPCPYHWTTGCKDVDECESNPCQHGANCINGNNIYTCDCVPGYDGVNCEIDINECLSGPCYNGGTCNDHVNSYTCTCCEDYTGTHYETDMCLPNHSVGADVVFVLDSSLSQDPLLFDRQKQYVKDFISMFPTGISDFQFSVVTFSLEATVRFYLNTYNTNVSLLNAVDIIKYTTGPSFTGEALRRVREDVLVPTAGMRVSVPKYVIVLTDGLSSNITDTRLQADILKLMGVQMIAVGFGGSVCQTELISIASHWMKVFPASSRDAVNSILQLHVMPTCPDCFQNTSDISILMDASEDIPIKQFYTQLDAIRTLVKVCPVSKDGVHLSYIRFAADVQEEFGFIDHFTAADVIVDLSATSRLTQLSGSANVSKVLNHMTQQGFSLVKGHRLNARKFVLLFSNGDFADKDAVQQEANLLKDSGITLVTIGIGKDANMTSLREIASDPALVYIVGDDVYTELHVLYSLVGSFTFDVCEFD